ncbi:MAG: hypothetical protein ACK56W_19410 [Pirellula sp.]|jgi:hypothetical protein|nr:hypothetical protein [Pirellula sp.]
MTMMIRSCIAGVLAFVLSGYAVCQQPEPILPPPAIYKGNCLLRPLSGSAFTIGAGDFSFARYFCEAWTPSFYEFMFGENSHIWSHGSVFLHELPPEYGSSGLTGSTVAVAVNFFDDMETYNPSVATVTLGNSALLAGFGLGFWTSAEHGAILAATAPPDADVCIMLATLGAQSLGILDDEQQSYLFVRAGMSGIAVTPTTSMYSRAYLDPANNFSQEYEFGVGAAGVGHAFFANEYVTPRGPFQPALDSQGNDLDVIVQLELQRFNRNGSQMSEATVTASATLQTFQLPTPLEP